MKPTLIKFIMKLGTIGAAASFLACPAYAAKAPKRGSLSDIALVINVPDNLPDALRVETIRTAIEAVIHDELAQKDYTFGGVQGILTVNLISFRKEHKENKSKENNETTTQDLYSANISAKLNDASNKIIWSETIKYPKSNFLAGIVRAVDPDEPEEVIQKAIRSLLKSMLHASKDPVPPGANPLPLPNTNTEKSTPLPKSSPDNAEKPGKAPASAESYMDNTEQKYTNALKLHAWLVNSDFHLNGKIPPGSSTGTLVLATNPPFSPGTILNSPTLKNYAKQKMVFMWDGYINIKEGGPHIIVVELYNLSRDKDGRASFCIYVDGEYKAQVQDGQVRIDRGENNALIANVNLSNGMHRLQIPFDNNHNQYYPYWDYVDVAMRIRIKGPDDDEAVELKAKNFYYPVKK